MKATPNRWGRFDDRHAALVSLVLTAAFLFVGELMEISIKNRSVPDFIIVRKKLEINGQNYPVEKAKNNAQKYTKLD